MQQLNLFVDDKSSQKIVIWDGPDMCGKTNIAKAYSEKSGITLYKDVGEWSSGLHTDNFVNMIRYSDMRTLDLVKKLKFDIMFDRAYPSEWVYSQIFNRKTDGFALHVLDEEYAKLGAKIILCRRSNYDKIKDDRYKEIDSDKLKLIDDLYYKFCRWTVCDVMTLWVDDYYHEEYYDEYTCTTHTDWYDVESQLQVVDRFIY